MRYYRCIGTTKEKKWAPSMKYSAEENNKVIAIALSLNEQKHVSRDEWVIGRLESVIQFQWKANLYIYTPLYYSYICLYICIYRVVSILCAIWTKLLVYACTRTALSHHHICTWSLCFFPSFPSLSFSYINIISVHRVYIVMEVTLLRNIAALLLHFTVCVKIQNKFIHNG